VAVELQLGCHPSLPLLADTDAYFEHIIVEIFHAGRCRTSE